MSTQVAPRKRRFRPTGRGNVTCILPSIRETIEAGGQVIVREKELGTVQINLRGTDILDNVVSDILAAQFRHIVEEVTEESEEIQIVTLTGHEDGESDSDTSYSEDDSELLTANIYPDVGSKNHEYAASILASHGVDKKALVDKHGNFNNMKINKAAKKLGLVFPNY